MRLTVKIFYFWKIFGTSGTNYFENIENFKGKTFSMHFVQGPLINKFSKMKSILIYFFSFNQIFTLFSKILYRLILDNFERISRNIHEILKIFNYLQNLNLNYCNFENLNRFFYNLQNRNYFQSIFKKLYTIVCNILKLSLILLNLWKLV